MTLVQSAYQFYLSKGIGVNAAAGIVGVLNYESALNPLAENNTGTDTGGVLNSNGAIGVAQWNGSRQAALAAFASEKSLNWQDLNTQLLFVLTECANSYPSVWSAIQSNTNVSDFITLFVTQYENPKDPAPEIAAALTTAQSLLATPTPVPPPPDPELQALSQIIAILSPFSSAAQKRLIDYLSSRYGA